MGETDFVKEIMPRDLSKYFLMASVGILAKEIQAIFINAKAFDKSLAKIP